MGAHQRASVSAHQRVSVGAHQRVSVGAHQRASVGAHQRVSVGAAHVITSRPARGTRTCAIVHGCIVKRCTQAASVIHVHAHVYGLGGFHR